MELVNDTAVFKSVDFFYGRELRGEKLNTCRHIPRDSWDGFDLWARRPLKTVRIVQADDPDEYFERQVTGVTCICDMCHMKCAHTKMYVISWEGE